CEALLPCRIRLWFPFLTHLPPQSHLVHWDTVHCGTQEEGKRQRSRSEAIPQLVQQHIVCCQRHGLCQGTVQVTSHTLHPGIWVGNTPMLQSCLQALGDVGERSPATSQEGIRGLQGAWMATDVGVGAALVRWRQGIEAG